MNRPVTFLLLLFLACLCVLFAGQRVLAERAHDDAPHEVVTVSIDSGLHDGAEAERLVFSRTIHVEGATWLRLQVADYHLGNGSYIMFTSQEDGGRQRHDSATLPEWSNWSAFFNGDTISVELFAAPGDQGVFVRINSVVAGNELDAHQAESTESPETLCGPDNRVATTDQRTGRLRNGAWAYCTAWLISNGAVLTAGHCVDRDPDREGQLLPDGILDLGPADVIEFNVPASNANGTINFSLPQHQYPIILNTVIWNFDGVGQGLGKDWAVFRVRPVDDPQGKARLPHHEHGFFRVSDHRPNPGDLIRISGYGIDETPPGTTMGENAATRTNQTSTGPFVQHIQNGADISLWYAVDTTGANSGSPIILANFPDRTVGIHTNGDCPPDGTSANLGTSFEVDALEIAIQRVWGPRTLYVDQTLSFPQVQNGRIYQPFDTVSEGLADVQDGGVLSIVEGTYRESVTISKPVTLIAPVGPVTIGGD